MSSKIISFIAFAVAVCGVLFLVQKKYIFSQNPVAIVIQLCSVVLMVWARITFGVRSFHATANATKGALVTKGPYSVLRHPIYASLIYFFWATVIAFPFIETIVAVAIITVALYVRMILEEKSLLATYEEYAAYAKRTSRIIPFLF